MTFVLPYAASHDVKEAVRQTYLDFLALSYHFIQCLHAFRSRQNFFVSCFEIVRELFQFELLLLAEWLLLVRLFNEIEEKVIGCKRSDHDSN